jgi:ADP-ribose pyrophosphatase YjhB (NUDIX family)
MKENQFCAVCGTKIAKPDAQHWWCDTCKQDYFANPRPTVDIILFNTQGQVLVTERAFEPGKGMWDFPGGFVEFDETLEQAVYREIEEELGLAKKDLGEPTYLTSYFSRYPWGKTSYHLSCTVFTASLKGSPKILANDDVAAAKFYELTNLQAINFSHRRYPELVMDAAKKLNISKAKN